MGGKSALEGAENSIAGALPEEGRVPGEVEAPWMCCRPEFPLPPQKHAQLLSGQTIRESTVGGVPWSPLSKLTVKISAEKPRLFRRNLRVPGALR